MADARSATATPPAADGGPSATADREVVVRRVFDAPARVVFRAWREPELLKRWFGPKGYPLTLAEVDFRVGGRFRFAMTGPGGKQQTPFGGTYREIVPDRRIVFDNGFELRDAPRMVWTVTFDERDGKTTLTVHTLFDSAATRATHVGAGLVQGLQSAFDQLAEVVAS